VNVSRADFLKICVAALTGRNVAAAWAAPTGGVLAAASAPLQTSLGLKDATAGLFQQHLNTTFAVLAGGGVRVPLLLAQVTERPTTQGIEQFSLSFHAAPGATLAQGTHPFQHPALGAFDLFVSPVGIGSQQSKVYEACFSRVRKAQDVAARSPHAPAALRGILAC
jgi:hypothetical protein